MVAGCSQTLHTASLPGMSWPELDVYGAPRAVPRSATVLAPPHTDVPEKYPTHESSSLDYVIERSAWTSAEPRLSDIDMMNGVSRITIHHEGSPEPVLFSGYQATAHRLEMIRRSHVGYRGWADIGYHYIIDRAGRVWEGRPVIYQGAHVRNHNPHNIGVMLMGNFELQQPTQAQLAALEKLVTDLRHIYDVPVNRIYTHGELVATRCPGTNLQVRVNRMRQRGAFK